MEHDFVTGMQKALDWSGPENLGKEYARGALEDPGLCARLLTPERLMDMVMRRSLSAPQFRLFQDGAEVHPARFLEDVSSRRGQSVRTTDMRRLKRLLEAGCTVVLDQADFFDPTLEVVCRALQWWSREVVQVNLYLTTGATDGFALHWDDHDVVIVQLAGDKDWEVRSCSRPVPMYRDAEPNDTPSEHVLFTGTLSAGEVMHIPRGCWHRAGRSERGEGFSLHATFGFTKRTGVHWLTWLADQSRRHELFRRDLERGDDQQADELFHALISLGASYPPSSFLRDRETERGACRHVPSLDFLGSPAAVVCVTDFPPRIESADDKITVTSGSSKITFAAAAELALQYLLSGAPVRLDALAVQTGINADAVAKVLIEEEICAPLTPELLSGYTGLVTKPVF